MKPLTRTDAAPNAPNQDIETPLGKKTVDDEAVRRGHMAARAADAAMKAVMRLDAEEEAGKAEKLPKDSKKDADAGEKIDKILECLDAIGKRFDALGSRMDAIESAKKDGAEAAQLDRKKKADEDGPAGAGKSGSGNSEKGEPREMTADRRKDAYTDADEVRNECSQVWTDAERASSAWGSAAVHPWDNETVDQYRRRVSHHHQQYSDAWRGVNFRELSGTTLKNACDQVFADSYAAASSNSRGEGADGLGELREVRKINRDTGHVIKEYYGHPMSWMQQFTGGRRLARFNLSKIRGDK